MKTYLLTGGTGFLGSVLAVEVDDSLSTGVIVDVDADQITTANSVTLMKVSTATGTS